MHQEIVQAKESMRRGRGRDDADLIPWILQQFFVFTSDEKEKLENEIKGKDLTEIDLTQTTRK